MRIRPLTPLALLGALLCACGGDPAEETPALADANAPDVVVVLLDTLRADALSIYGAEREVAPFLAGMARQGTVFERAWSTSTWTAPATASVLTGCYPDRHGVTRGFLAHFREADGGQVGEQDLEQIELHAISTQAATLAERFQRLGYATFGMAANINIGDEMEFDRGFERFERHHGETAKELRQRLLDWKEELGGERPSFLYLHFNDVHEPYHLRPRFFAPPTDTEDEVQRAYAQYLSEVGYVDSFLARLAGELNWGEDTLLVVVADHGEEFMDHGQMAHEFTLFSELSQVPMVVYGPSLGVQAGRFPENVSVVDLAPTLFELVGLPQEEFDGRSLAEVCMRRDKTPTADERNAWAERPLFMHRFERGRHLWGVVIGRWKLIQNFDGRLALFDLVEDPRETRNLREVEAERCERLLELLDEHRGRGVQAESRRADVTIDQDLLDRLKSLGYVK